MEQKLWRDFDLFLLGCIIALLSIGIISVYSATLNAVTAYGTSFQALFPRHIANVVSGLIVMALMALIDYRLFSSLARPIFIITVILLITVLLIGRISEGAQSWLVIGARTIQPSEMAKLFIVISLAAYWAHFEDRASSWMIQAGSLLITAIPLGLVLLQPDFGTAMVFGGIWLVMAWTAGMRWQQLLVLAFLAIPVAFVGWEALDEEQRTRMLTFYWMLTDPSKIDPNEGYNIQQSMNAISSGGLFGTGLTNGPFSQGNYIPVQYSDFIFAVIAEELGFIGGAVLLLFQGLLLWLAVSIAKRARDMFGRLIAVGIFAMILLHVLINIGVATSLMPVTGIPLPFISYGGTFTITCLAAMGLLESISMRWRKIAF